MVNTLPQGKHYDYEVSAHQVAGFASYGQEIYQGWNLSLGARLENISYDYKNQMIDGRTDEFGVPCALGCRYNRPADRTDSFTNLSPKFALS